MSHVHLAWGLPFCPNPKGTQTHLSVGLRITGIALGILAAIVGTLVLFNMPGLSQLGNTVGWTLASLGAFLILVGMIIKCVKTQSKTEKQEQSKHANNQLVEAEYEKNNGQADNKKAASDPIITSQNQAPADVIALFPNWLIDYLGDLPYLELPDDAPVMESLKNVTDSIALFSRGGRFGMYIRLSVEHKPIDSVYTPPGDPPPGGHVGQETIGEIRSSNEPFTLPILVWRSPNTYRMILAASPSDLYIKHRNVLLEIGNVLFTHPFCCFSNEKLTQELISHFIHTKRQDDLNSRYREHPGWILLRLFTEGCLEIREFEKGDMRHNFQEPALGHWKISVDRK